MAQDVFPNLALRTGAFAIAAKGASFAATVRAPLTGTVPVAEMTAGFALPPAPIVTCMSAGIADQSIGSKPVYDLLLARTLDNAQSTT